jgi:prolyl-tRNA synthetase
VASKQRVGAARRPGREGKISVSLADIMTIETSRRDSASDVRQSTSVPAFEYPCCCNYDQFKKAVETGFAFAGWCGSGDCEGKIKEETRATMRCIPLDQEAVLGAGGAAGTGKCVSCGQAAKERAIFARAY